MNRPNSFVSNYKATPAEQSLHERLINSYASSNDPIHKSNNAGSASNFSKENIEA